MRGHRPPEGYPKYEPPEKHCYGIETTHDDTSVDYLSQQPLLQVGSFNSTCGEIGITPLLRQVFFIKCKVAFGCLTTMMMSQKFPVALLLENFFHQDI